MAQARIHHRPGPDDPIEPVILKPDREVTSRYEHVDLSRARGAALLRVVHGPRAPWQNDAQALVSRIDKEGYYLNLSIMRHNAHIAASELGFPARCTRPACRRARACVADRHKFDWSFPGPWMPPCASTKRMVEEVRGRMRQTGTL